MWTWPEDVEEILAGPVKKREARELVLGVMQRAFAQQV
jgi:hypothetical protein